MDGDERWESVLEALSSASEAPGGTLPYIDSHTGGEPTRVLLEPVEAPDPTWSARVVGEPRGSGILVGVALQRPESRHAAARLHFFNNVGSLRMCVHATIGLVETMARTRPEAVLGPLVFETAAGTIRATRGPDGVVEIRNVESWWQREASVEVDGVSLHGDIAWAGNWFFLTHDPEQRVEAGEIGRLTNLTHAIRSALGRAGIRGADGAEIDHVHLRVDGPDRLSQVFVMCPGGAYDRSPCGTGTCALTAVMAHRGTLAQGERVKVQSVTGGEFEAEFRPSERGVVPTIRGRAHITGQGWLIFDESDPFRNGL